jgi:hypothetical protein
LTRLKATNLLLRIEWMLRLHLTVHGPDVGRRQTVRITVRAWARPTVAKGGRSLARRPSPACERRRPPRHVPHPSVIVRGVVRKIRRGLALHVRGHVMLERWREVALLRRHVRRILPWPWGPMVLHRHWSRMRRTEMRWRSSVRRRLHIHWRGAPTSTHPLRWRAVSRV